MEQQTYFFFFYMHKNIDYVYASILQIKIEIIKIEKTFIFGGSISLDFEGKNIYKYKSKWVKFNLIGEVNSWKQDI